MKNKNMIVSLLLALAILVSACSTPATATPAPATTAPQAAEPTVAVATTAPAAAPTDAPTADAATDQPALTLTIWTDDNFTKALEKMVEPVQKEYGVKLVVQQLKFEEVMNQFQLAAPAGQGPDILVTNNGNVGELVKNGLVIPLSLGDVAPKYDPVAIKAWQYNGEQYGLPINTENVGFFINKDIVPACPTTWTEVRDISRKISASNGDNVDTNKYGFVLNETDAYHWYPLMTAFGGYVFAVTDKGYNPQDLGLDSEGTLAAAKYWDAYIKEKLQPAGIDDEIMLQFFETGKAAMIITGPWWTKRVVASGIKFEICPIPGEVKKNGQPFLGSFGYVISGFSKNQSLAEIFVKDFLSREENMRAIFDNTPQPPANLAVIASLTDPYLAAFAVAGKDALPLPAIPEMGAVWEGWTNALTLVSQQRDDPVNAFTTAAEQIRKKIAEGTK